MPSQEERVDAVIAEYGEWFQSLGNSPLLRSEMAMVKTFAYFLIRSKGRKNKLPVLEDKKEEE